LNSVASENSDDGIYTANDTNPHTVSIDNSSASGNGLNGIEANGKPNVILGRSVITGNVAAGIANGTSPNSLYSYGDNRNNDNGTMPTDDIMGSSMIPYTAK
jgi:hypothetical protein